jgi:hypothetical protein
MVQLRKRSAAFAAGIALIAALVGASAHAASILYRQTAVEACLRAERVVFAPVPHRKVNHLVLRRFPGVTGTIGIPQGGGPAPPGMSYGPAIDSGTLIFERTAALAQRDRAGLYDLLHDPRISPFNPPAPPQFIRAMQSVRRNVIVLWLYPRRHPALSMKLIERCMPRL